MIRVCVLAAATLALAALGPPPAQAQGGPAPGAAPPIDCAAIAANPNAGMDKASCEAMQHAGQAYQDALSDPSASQPGDAAMTCDDIKAEFMQQRVSRPPPEEVAATRAATSDFMGKTAQLQAEATAMAAASSAENLAAGAAGLANPVAGRAAQAAANAHQAAEQAELNAKAKAELAPRYRAMMSGDAALVANAAAQLDANPRIARLVQLADEKHCHGW